MNTIVWIVQGVLAFAFLLAALLKLSTPKPKLEQKMPWAEDYSASTIKFIGVAELMGAIGLILPMSLNILPILTQVAAFALALNMVLAMRAHARRKESKEVVVNLVLFLLALFVALSRAYLLAV